MQFIGPPDTFDNLSDAVVDLDGLRINRVINLDIVGCPVSPKANIVAVLNSPPE